MIKWQAIIGVAPAFLCFFYAGVSAGFSASYGLLINLIANGVMALFLFKNQGALAAKSIVRLFYLGEAFKIIITIFMFLVAIVFLKLNFLPLILTFIFSQIIWFFCPLFVTKKVSFAYE